MFVVFAFSLCNYFLISYSVVRENAWYNYCSLKFVETWVFCGIACDLSWTMFHVHLKRMYILLLLDLMSYTYLLNEKMFALRKENYDKPRWHIKKERRHFANKGPHSQSYDFSNSRVWMRELDP